MSRIRSSVAMCAAVAAVLVATGCAGGDPGPGTIPEATAATTVPSGPATTVAPATAPPTTIPGPRLADRLDLVEVSARWSAVDEVLSAAAEESLADVVVPEGDPGRVQMSVRCSPVDGLAPAVTDGLVVRLAEPDLDRSAGGLTAFELVAAAGVAGLVPGDSASAGVLTDAVAIRFEVDGEPRTTIAATVVVDEDPTTGSFRGELADGSVIEGAYRCI